jgi:ribosome-binding factor A
MAHSSAPSQRMLRAGELIRHALAEVFLRGETNDPELDKLTPSIVEVQISPDLKIATAYVRTLIMGQEPQLLEALNRNRKYIRMLMTPRLAMKYTPDIRFRIDTALDYAGKIDEILRSPVVKRDIEKDDE